MNDRPHEPRDRGPAERLDLETLRARLAAGTHRDFWRSLDELAEDPAAVAALARELPEPMAGLVGATDRRQFLRLMAASLGLAGLQACTRQPEERIVPYVRQPERLTPGQPLFFATALARAGRAIGVVAESHEGRPTKLEGNPLHPASLGSIDPPTQAELLGLYDPDRSQVIMSAGTIRPWSAFRDAMANMLSAQRGRKGAGLRILTETVTSPTLTARIEQLMGDLPQARWHTWDATRPDAGYAGARLVLGGPVETQYRFDAARVILSLDADFLTAGPMSIRASRDFSRARRLDAEGGPSRLYVVEATPSVTGGVADHRLALRANEVEAVTRAIATGLGLGTQAGPPLPPASARWVDAVLADLRAHRGAGVVVPGEGQPPVVHALAHVINIALGAIGNTVVCTAPVEPHPLEHAKSLADLVADMNGGAVDCLLILGGNPVFTAPADLRFAERLEKVPLRVHLGLYDDETAEHCHWHLPEAHPLESWGDLRAADGTASIVQPMIAPLYGGHSAIEVVAALAPGPERSGHDLVREQWRQHHGEKEFEAFWRRALHDGMVAGSAFPPTALAPRTGWDRGSAPPAAGEGLEIVFRPDPYLLDGRFANNAWLEELPQPITKLVWGNAVLVAPATAERLGVTQEDVVEVTYAERTVRAPIWIAPGHAADSITVHLGRGRRRAGSVGTGVGFDAYALRTSLALYAGAGATLTPTGERTRLATTQDHHRMEGRPLVRTGTLAEYRAHPDFAREMEEVPGADDSLYPSREYAGHAWGMTIDLSACIGCNACTLACTAENNIPVVGREEVLRGHEMHWIRVDRYYRGSLDTPEIVHQPVPCMHCEDAPCEVVCPVNATVHSSEGLNDMVYNRCVGTRYCSNNCPYKVRRFNYFLYTNWRDETVKMAQNPDVTVRSRGVMEKCTYCVQRIERARIVAHKEGRPLRDGEIVTACQQACPAEAIVFGDVNDPQSRVARLKADPRNYLLLGNLNTRPRTSYLAAVRSPNPALGGGSV